MAAADTNEHFGGYVLVRELASGGMATVYEARREGPDGFTRRVAIKRIHPHLAKDRAFVEMFLDEARLAARIAHPNVCQVLDYGKHEGASFIAMEFLDGKSVAEVASLLARSGRTTEINRVRFAASIIVEAAEGLHAAHELRDEAGLPLDVVHRDVSPQNLFVTYDGEVKVVDFGIASARDKNHETATGEVKGKFAYMSPEQFLGRIDRRCDVWALGVVLWELLALRRLFRRKTQPETVLAVERDPIPLVSEIAAGVPADFNEVIVGALQRVPTERTADALTLATQLSRVLARHGGLMPRRERATYLAEVLGGEVPIASSVFSPTEPSEASVAPSKEAAPTEAVTAFQGRREAAPTVDALPTEPRPLPTEPRPLSITAVAVGVAIVGALSLGLAVVASGTTRGVTATSIDRRNDSVDAGLSDQTPASTPSNVGEAAALNIGTESSDAGVSDRGASGPSEVAQVAVGNAVQANPAASDRGHAHRRVRPSGAVPAEVRPAAQGTNPSVPPSVAAATSEGSGVLVVPAGLAVCIDATCDQEEPLHGPRRRTVPAGRHTIHFQAGGSVVVEVPAAGSVTVPRP